MELIDGCLMEVERLRAVLPYWDELAREEEEEAQREIDRASGEEEEKEEEIFQWEDHAEEERKLSVSPLNIDNRGAP